MTSLADRTVAALRRLHDDLAALVPALADDQLAGPSGSSEWPVAQVLSHLGSGAEIGLAGHRAALAGEPAPGGDLAPAIWDRWNAMSPREQAVGFVESDESAVRFLEEAGSERIEATQVQLSWLPMPLAMTAVLGMRLNEVVQHAWDVRVGLDPAATADEDGAALVLEHYDGGLGFLLGFAGKADQLGSPARVGIAGTDLVLTVDEQVALTRGGPTTATLTAPAESVLRLLGGRLSPEHTPDGVAVEGDVTLDDLRQVFPGY